jgi:hypothetical protein
MNIEGERILTYTYAFPSWGRQNQIKMENIMPFKKIIKKIIPNNRLDGDFMKHEHHKNILMMLPDQ